MYYLKGHLCFRAHRDTKSFANGIHNRASNMLSHAHKRPNNSPLAHLFGCFLEGFCGVATQHGHTTAGS